MGASFILFVLLLFSNFNESHQQTKCPLSDAAKRQKEASCKEGTRYHCFADNDGFLFADGCFRVKLCRKGSHPVVDGEHIVCALCKTGFQKIEPLASNEFQYASCEAHSPECDVTQGYIECRPPSREQDRGCTCSGDNGYKPSSNTSDCKCFTDDDSCFCSFEGCPPGKVRGERHSGKCVLPPTTETPTTKPLLTTTKEDKNETEDSSLHPGWITFIVLAIVFFIACIVVAYLIYFKKCIRSAPKDAANGELGKYVPVGTEGTDTSQPEETAPSAPAAQTTQNPPTAQNGTGSVHVHGPLNIGKLQHVTISLSQDLHTNTIPAELDRVLKGILPNNSETDNAGEDSETGTLMANAGDSETGTLMANAGDSETGGPMASAGDSETGTLMADTGESHSSMDEETFRKVPAGDPELGDAEETVPKILEKGDEEQTLPKVILASEQGEDGGYSLHKKGAVHGGGFDKKTACVAGGETLIRLPSEIQT